MNVRIIWSNSAGPIAEVTAQEGVDAARQLVAMIRDCGGVDLGDRFTVEPDADAPDCAGCGEAHTRTEETHQQWRCGCCGYWNDKPKGGRA